MALSHLLVLLGFLALSQSQSASYIHTFTGGLPFCTQCGKLSEYACSPDAQGSIIGNWNNGAVQFNDPIPSGNYPTGMIVTIRGSYSCNGLGSRTMFGVALNGYVHGVKETSKGDACKCDTCDGQETVSVSFRNGVPKYKKGTANFLQILPYTDSLCINTVNVTFTYAPATPSPPTPLPEYYMDLKIPVADRVGCPVCNDDKDQWCSTASNNTFTINFQDPLPQGFNYLVAVDIYASFNFIQKASYRYTIVEAKLQSERIQSKTISDLNWVDKCGCLADYQFLSSTYQRGWPNYVQKGTNTISFSVDKYSQSYGNVCIGRLAIKLVYYPAGEDEPEVIYLDKENIQFE